MMDIEPIKTEQDYDLALSDFEEYISTRARVSEVLNGKRGLVYRNDS